MTNATILDEFETLLFLPKGETRKGEGGLRTKGYFKKSYDDKPLITIITVVYNGEKYLEETIQSVINQTYDNVEYIIIDGGSTDGTVDIIKKYEDKIDYWMSEKDNGISDAFNKGITASTGIRLLFLNAGDHFYTNEILADLQPVFIEYSDTELIYGKIMLVDNERNEIKAYGKPQNFNVLRRHMTLPHQAMFHHNSFFKKNGLYDTNIKTSMDYDLIMKNFKHIKFHFIDKIISNMLSDGVSQTHIVKLYKEHLAIQLRYRLNHPLISYYYFALNVFSYHLKKIIKRYL
jgi:glycosyltransferase involved in cell wall biosynthesis